MGWSIPLPPRAIVRGQLQVHCSQSLVLPTLAPMFSKVGLKEHNWPFAQSWRKEFFRSFFPTAWVKLCVFPIISQKAFTSPFLFQAIFTLKSSEPAVSQEARQWLERQKPHLEPPTDAPVPHRVVGSRQKGICWAKRAPQLHRHWHNPIEAPKSIAPYIISYHDIIYEVQC